jgi:hypothetical protein
MNLSSITGTTLLMALGGAVLSIFLNVYVDHQAGRTADYVRYAKMAGLFFAGFILTSLMID